MKLLKLLRATTEAGLFLAAVVAGSVLFSPQVNAFPAYGDGTALKPYRIASCAQLSQIGGAGKYYVIIRNLNCAGTPFTTVTSFGGNLDGQNHIIYNLNVTGAGLFGSISSATIKNLTIASGSVSGTTNVGSLAGTSGGLLSTIQNVHSSMSVTGTTRCGGFIGSANNNYAISQSSYSGTIQCLSSIGGFLGSVGGGSITDSFTTGTIAVDNPSGIVGAGGLYGTTTSINTHVVRSYSTMFFDVTNMYMLSDWYGGLVGRLPTGGTIENSFGASTNNGVFGSLYGVYGLSGISTGTITNSYYDLARLMTEIGCDGAGETGCTAVNTDGSDPDYFKGTSSAPPLDTWNFTTI